MRLLSVAALVFTAFSLPAGQSVAADYACEGRTATIVGSPNRYSLRGTASADVIVTNGSASVSAGAGDDLVCVTSPQGKSFPAVNLDAGPGNDEVRVLGSYSSNPPGDASTLYGGTYALGAGSDRFFGGPGQERVQGGGAFIGDDAADSERDVFEMGGGYDTVVAGDGGPFVDEVHLGSGGGRVEIAATTLAPGGVLDGDAGSALAIRTQSGGQWVVDNGEQTALRDNGDVFAWTGFTDFEWDVFGQAVVDFQGSSANESFRGRASALAMGAGSDFAEVSLASSAVPGSDVVLDGGTGTDRVDVTDGFRKREVLVDIAAARAMVSDVGSAALTGIEAYGVVSSRGGTVRGTPGSDLIFGDACNLLLDGSAGDDQIVGETYGDELGCHSPDIKTRLRGGPGDDQITGTMYSEEISGGAGNDTIRSDRGADRVAGGPGDDALFGGRGSDRLAGQEGADRLFGQDADDLVIGGPGRDQGLGGEGRDTCLVEVRRQCERA